MDVLWETDLDDIVHSIDLLRTKLQESGVAPTNLNVRELMVAKDEEINALRRLLQARDREIAALRASLYRIGQRSDLPAHAQHDTQQRHTHHPQRHHAHQLEAEASPHLPKYTHAQHTLHTLHTHAQQHTHAPTRVPGHGHGHVHGHGHASGRRDKATLGGANALYDDSVPDPYTPYTAGELTQEGSSRPAHAAAVQDSVYGSINSDLPDPGAANTHQSRPTAAPNKRGLASALVVEGMACFRDCNRFEAESFLRTQPLLRYLVRPGPGWKTEGQVGTGGPHHLSISYRHHSPTLDDKLFHMKVWLQNKLFVLENGKSFHHLLQAAQDASGSTLISPVEAR